MFPANLGTNLLEIEDRESSRRHSSDSLFPLNGSRGNQLTEVMTVKAHDQVA